MAEKRPECDGSGKLQVECGPPGPKFVPLDCPGCPKCRPEQQPLEDGKTRPGRCPSCNSNAANMFPATSYGGEALACADDWHLTSPNEPPNDVTRELVERGKRNLANRQPEQGEDGDWPEETTTHELKCWPPYFEDILLGRKNFECRVADRDFKVGDLLRLREFDPEKGYTGRELSEHVTYVLHGGAGGQFGIKPGNVVMSLYGPAPTQPPISDGERGRLERIASRLATWAVSLKWSGSNPMADVAFLRHLASAPDPREEGTWPDSPSLASAPPGVSGEEAIPRDYWREVPCGHPPDPVAMWNREGMPVCHCGRILDLADRMAERPPEAPGPIVYCDKCGCYVAIPPKPSPPEPSIQEEGSGPLTKREQAWSRAAATDRQLAEKAEKRADDLQARLSETKAAWSKSDEEKNAEHVKVMAAATEKRQELEARLEKVEAERDREKALREDAYRYQQAAEDLLNPEQIARAKAEAALEEAAAEFERRAEYQAKEAKRDASDVARGYVERCAARSATWEEAAADLREKQAALKGAAPDCGGVAPALRAEADEWPYPDDPPDPL